MESNNFMNRDAEKPKEFCDRKQREAQELEALKAKLVLFLFTFPKKCFSSKKYFTLTL